MKHLARLLLLGLAAALISASGTVRAQKKDDKKDDLKSNLVVLEGLKSKAPADWKREKPANLLLKYQFRLPRVKDDKNDTQVLISEVIGSGTADKKIEGWRNYFQPPAGKTIEEVSRIAKVKVGKKEVLTLDVWGTYLDKKRPQDPPESAIQRPGYRMVAAYFEAGDTPYFIRMIGPADSVAHYGKGFAEWLKAFE